MSAIVPVDSIPLDKRKKMIEDLSVKAIQKKGKAKYTKQTSFNVYEIVDDDFVTVPFSYYYHFIGNAPNGEGKFDQIDASFNISLFDRQKSIRQEAVEMLNKERCLVLSLFTGFGKCLAPDTPVLMWDGGVKTAKNIRVGDVLIGDDSTPRNVKSICKGVDEMFKVVQDSGDSYIVNRPHILSLFCTEHRTVSWSPTFEWYMLSWFDRTDKCMRYRFYDVSGIKPPFESKEDALEELLRFRDTIEEDPVIDINIDDYMSLDENSKQCLKGMKASVNFPYQPVDGEPYTVGYRFAKDNDINHLPRDYIVNSRKIRLGVIAGIVDAIGYVNGKNCTMYLETSSKMNDVVYLLRSLGFHVKHWNEWEGFACRFSGTNMSSIPCKVVTLLNSTGSCMITDIKVEPCGVGEYYGFTIDGNRRFLLGDFTVTHNTLFAIYLACKIKLKTVVFCHRVIIIDQWIKSIHKACGDDVKVQLLTAKSKIDPSAQFYIINVTNVPKRQREDFDGIGTLIVDEAHCLCTEKYAKSFSYVFPKYLIGCTATPVRSDGQDRVIELFAGVNIIYRPLNALFNVYLYHTQFKPKVEKTDDGDMIWGSVIESQATNDARNCLIVDIVRYFTTRNILVLCKLKKHASILCEALERYGVDVDTYMGSQKVVNYSCRVLIATYSKSGVGMDHPKLDMLILAGDCEENWMQYLGRVFRREHHVPIIVDLIDSKFRPLKKHSDTRIEICKESGGQIKNLVNSFPEFEKRRVVFGSTLN